MNKSDHSPLFTAFQRLDLTFERGEGCWLYTVDGERYLDFTSGIAVNVLGHAHPHLVTELKSQAEKLWHTSNLFNSPLQEKLAHRLIANCFADRVFFTNSGAEAIECAIKTARRFHYLAGMSERHRIITFEGAFHGRTLATIAAGGREKYMEGFGPKVPGFDQVPFDDEAALRDTITPQTAAILIEPVQGEGGLRLVTNERLRRLRQLCDSEGILLIFDEVQCGIGRTGKLFAYQWSDIEPDIMAIAKGIGGGFPLGACLARENCAAAITPGSHGTTFGGNPLAMAVGNGVLDVVLEGDFLSQVEARANRLKQGLAGLADRYGDVIGEVRGRGLLTGFQCVKPNNEVMNELQGEKMLTVAASDNVIRLLPPLNISDEDIAEALSRMDRAFAKLSTPTGIAS